MRRYSYSSHLENVLSNYCANWAPPNRTNFQTVTHAQHPWEFVRYSWCPKSCFANTTYVSLCFRMRPYVSNVDGCRLYTVPLIFLSRKQVFCKNKNWEKFTFFIVFASQIQHTARIATHHKFAGKIPNNNWHAEGRHIERKKKFTKQTNEHKVTIYCLCLPLQWIFSFWILILFVSQKTILRNRTATLTSIYWWVDYVINAILLN